MALPLVNATLVTVTMDWQNQFSNIATELGSMYLTNSILFLLLSSFNLLVSLAEEQ